MSVEPLRRIRRVSRAMAWLVTLGGFALLGLYVWFWSDAELLRATLAEMTGLAIPPELTPLAYWGSLVASSLPFALGLAALVVTRRLFLGYARGEIFTAQAARRLGSLGTLLLAGVGAGVVARTLAVLALTWENPPGQRQLAISFDSQDFGLAVLALLLMVVAWVLGEAARLAEENRQFI